jgi:hypothetical protein
MSREAATAFLKALEEKPELEEQLRNHNPQHEPTVENEKQLRNIAAKGRQVGELSEEDLEKVAGGGGGLDGVGPGSTLPHG